MNYLLLVSHGGFAEGLRTSLAMFAEDKMGQIVAAGLKNGSSVEDFALEFREAVAPITSDDRVIILADIVGGSPLTTALGVLEEKGLLETATILGGMNLPMAITSAVMKDLLTGEEFVNAVMPEARAALQEFKIASESTEDDDDI